MPHSSPRDPAYRLHKPSGGAVVTLPDGNGGRRDVRLGVYNSPESRAEYYRVLAEWRASDCQALPTPEMRLTVNELLLAYIRHIEAKFGEKKAGETSSTVRNIKHALRPLRLLYGHTAAADFGPKSLKAIQVSLAEKGLARNTINRRVGAIKTAFRWAESEELVPKSTYHALLTVRGLERGRSAAKETAPVRPVRAELVEATLPRLLPMVADMVRVQQLTGMRSGELVRMRGIDLDTSGTVWQYRPGSDQGDHGDHKTAHHGHARVVAIGPQAVEILKRRLVANVTEFLFSPAKALAEWNAQRREARKTKVQPSQQNRRKANRKRPPTKRYTTGTYRQAIERGAKKAGVPAWHPHQLRHAVATEIRKMAGIDAARAVLGHRSPAITEVYAELDMGKAAEVMAKMG